MRKTAVSAFLFAGVLLCAAVFTAPAAPAATFGLFDYGVHIDGTASFPTLGDAVPGGVDITGFDTTTGLGVVEVSVGALGPHYVGFFVDIEIDESLNGFSNEIGSTSGAPGAGMEWEIDEPGFVFGDIFDNFNNGVLDNTNALAVDPDDVSMALAFNFALAADQTALISFRVSETAPTSGFFLEQRDPDSQAGVFLSGSVSVRGGGPIIPEPSTWALFAGGLIALALTRRRKAGRGVTGTAAGLVLLLAGLAGPQPASAVQPIVKVVPFAPGSPLVPHDVFNGESTRLKGTSSVQGANFSFAWDPGDGSAPIVGTVTNQYVVEATHTYNAPIGTIFTATLTVTDTNTNESDSAVYILQMREKMLATEVNRAIDEGLWFLHSTMTRSTSANGVPIGNWAGGFAGSSSLANQAANVNAFEVSGHVESGSPDNPYTETVARGLANVFNGLAASAIADQTNPLGTFSPDANGNGFGVRVNQGNELYQGGMIIDAIVASGTPNAVTSTGPIASGANPGVRNRQYRDIVQDMVDYYSFCQYDPQNGGGGWRYSCNTFPDNSANQWAAIGFIPAERAFGAAVPQIVKDWNENWLAQSQNAVTGVFGYTNASPIWGPYATTPSGMVQLAADGFGRGDPRWDSAEAFIRANFANTGGAGNAIRDYYYGMFSFVKSMLLHDSDGDKTAEPIALLGGDLDWNFAEVSKGDPVDGVARTLVNEQNLPQGFWQGNNFSSAQWPFETAWAIQMLNRTVFSSGLPVAIISANPNPAIAGQIINLDGTSSFHQNGALNIISWDWDLDNDGQFDDATGVFATSSFPSVGNFPVGLRVCDDATPQACDDATLNIIVSTPPLAPTSDPGGPYNFCLDSNLTFFLDGTGSTNPDEGQSEPGQPGDTIQSYAWELSGGDNQFDDAAGPQPDVTALYTGLGEGSFIAQLRVTDTTATSFPNSQFGDLSDTASTQVNVLAGNDPRCACVDDLAARAKRGEVELRWTDTGAASYNVYRSLVQGGPYSFIANTTNTFSVYLDKGLTNGVTYYYVVRPTELSGVETCQSNESGATPNLRAR